MTAREGGLQAQARLYVGGKDVNDNEPIFEVGKFLITLIDDPTLD